MLTLDDIWRRLTTENIGFFPYSRRDKIPTVPGVYAWFLPLRLGKHPEDLLTFYRKISAYDAGSLGVANWKTEDAGFRWDPLSVEVRRNSSVQLPQASHRDWEAIAKAPEHVKETFRQSLFASTVFSRPLYVGLSNNLSRRYQEHQAGVAGKNDFHSRFMNYMDLLGEALTIEQLLFACVPVRSTDGAESKMTEEQIGLLENMLKVICQPVFDDK